MKNVIVTTMTNWVHEEVEEGLDPTTYKVVKDYGFDLLTSCLDAYAWWLPAAHAARVVRTLPEVTFSAPGPDWLVSLPLGITGRKIETCALGDLLLERWEGLKWVKPAEAKIEAFPPSQWEHSDLLKCSSGIPLDSKVQTNDRFIPMDDEHRFYVVNGEVATGSPYLINGVVWNDGIGWDRFEEAKTYAQMVVKSLQNDQPDSYVLDVAWDTYRKRWLVIEGNPTWCSGFYGSDMTTVVEAIHESMKSSEKWAWTPDPYLAWQANRKKKLEMEPVFN